MSKLFFRFRHQAAHAEDWVLFEGLAIRVLEAKALVARKTGHVSTKCGILRMFAVDGGEELSDWAMLPRGSRVVLRRAPRQADALEPLTPAPVTAPATPAAASMRRGVPQDANALFGASSASCSAESLDRHPGDILAEWLMTSFAGLRL